MEEKNDLSDLTEGAIKLLDLVKAMGKMGGGKSPRHLVVSQIRRK